ncbi:MAG: hypothetical protein LBQ65_01155 [Tannerellaceae bacterium]|jgi:hypothetical protein|nr:hypothetical protein [Tannerellaceae bacterium]
MKSGITIKLHYYNPGHETAVWQDTTNYTPPLNVRKMTTDLAFLPAWYAQEGDYVWIDGQSPLPLTAWLPEGIRPLGLPLTRRELEAKAASLPPMVAEPWGLSPHSLQLFQALKQAYGLSLDIPVWKREYTALTSRQTAAACLEEIGRLLPDEQIPRPPVFFSDMEELETCLLRQTGAWLLKAPYSSSGRGLLWLTGNRLSENDRKRAGGILRKQGLLSVEQALDKVLDFALEFHADGKGGLRYEGISRFETNSRGAYKGNQLRAQASLEEELLSYAGADSLCRIRQALAQTLRLSFAGLYTGYLGVDMLVYKKEAAFAIHPCIEINLRHTMGMAALRIYEHYLDPDAEGLFHIAYEPLPGAACARHRLMEQTYPPSLRSGRLHEGYLSLCPVTEETHYLAYVLAGSKKTRIFRP